MSDVEHAASANTEVATRDRTDETFEASLVAEKTAERAVMRSIVKCTAIGIPIGILFFTGLLFIAAGGDLSGWVVVGIGVTLGILAAVLFGMLGGVTIAAHAFEEVDKGEALHA